MADKDIDIEDVKISNRTPVRLVEPIVLSEEAEAACRAADAPVCPQPTTDPRDAHPHYLDPDYVDPSNNGRPYYFCSCQQDQTDERALPLTLYVEDQDEEPRTRDPKDDIYAALLLDLPPRTNKPYNYTDYPENLDDKSPLDLAIEFDYEPLQRRNPHLRQLQLGSADAPLDLCNGGRRVLAPGLHTLTVMVTDRPWMKDAEDRPQVGIPNIAAGATFDTITYMFRCHADSDDATDPCTCVDPNEVGS